MTGAKDARIADLERLLKRVEKTNDGCWIWTGSRTKGYGQIGWQGRVWLVHRAAYELFVGPIPEGLHLDHRCHTEDASCPGGEDCQHRLCVNPDHLTLVTQQENNRLAGIRRTHCRHGHEYTPENTLITPLGNRICRECRRVWQRQDYWRRAKVAT